MPKWCLRPRKTDFYIKLFLFYINFLYILKINRIKSPLFWVQIFITDF
nr:MAG TPA: hypothetical protein [Caudoviricetes sp.]